MRKTIRGGNQRGEGIWLRLEDETLLDAIFDVHSLGKLNADMKQTGQAAASLAEEKKERDLPCLINFFL